MGKLISIGQIIDRSWDHYSAFFKPLMKISLWALIIPVLVLLRILIVPSGEIMSLASLFNGQGDAMLVIGLILGVLISLIAVPVLTIWIYINLVKAVESQDKKKPTSLKALRKYGWTNFFSYFWVAILKSVLTALPLLLLVPGMILIFTNIYYNGGSFWGAFSNLTMLIGVVAALVLLILLGIKLGFSAFERLIAEKKGMSAVKGSYQLVTGRFWATLWRLLISKIVFGIGVALLHVIIALIILGIEYAFFPLSETQEAASAIFSLFLGTGVLVLSTPIFVIVDYIIYDNLLKTK